MNRARDHRTNDPTFIEWQKEYQAEQEAAKAVVEAADPVLQAQRALDAEALAVQELLRTGYVPDSMLPGVERMNGRVIANEAAAIRNWKYFADTCPTFQHWMADALLSAAERSDLAPIAPNYLALHNLMLEYGAYPEPPAVTETAPITEEPMHTPSELAVLKHQDYMTKIVGVDETGREWTDEAIDRELSAKDGLRLRRLFESGTRGDSRLLIYREIQDIKAQQEAERERLAAEQERGN